MKTILLALAVLCGCLPNEPDSKPQLKPESNIWEKVQHPDSWISVYRTQTPDGWLVLVEYNSHGTSAAIVSDQNHTWLAHNPEKNQ